MNAPIDTDPAARALLAAGDRLDAQERSSTQRAEAEAEFHRLSQLLFSGPRPRRARVEDPTLRTWLHAREHSRLEILALFDAAGRMLQAAHDEGRACGFGLDRVRVFEGDTARPLLPAPRRAATASRDQLQFCAALWEALHGAPPLVGAAQQPRASERGWTPSWLHAALVRGMQPDPRARFASMAALLRALAPPWTRA